MAQLIFIPEQLQGQSATLSNLLSQQCHIHFRSEKISLLSATAVTHQIISNLLH